jgi:hypothetical protein
MNWRDNWPPWQPPDAEDPDRGGMSQPGAYEAGLTDDPGCWVQPVEVYWSPRLDPRIPEYDPEFVAQVEWEEPGEVTASGASPGACGWSRLHRPLPYAAATALGR